MPEHGWKVEEQRQHIYQWLPPEDTTHLTTVNHKDSCREGGPLVGLPAIDDGMLVGQSCVGLQIATAEVTSSCSGSSGPEDVCVAQVCFSSPHLLAL